MLTFLLAAASAVTLQPQAAPASSEPAIFIVYGDYGRPGQPGNIERLLREWLRDGVIRGQVRRGGDADAAACIGRRHDDPIDHDCVRRLNPPRAGQSPVIAIVSRDSGRVIPVFDVTCIGPGGSESGSVNMNVGGAFAVSARWRTEAREAIGNCIARARRR